MSNRPTEAELVARFRALLPKAGDSNLVIGPGDDCAAVSLDAERLLLLTCDAQVEERHFRRSWYTPEELGRRLAAVNLSDVAAMGGAPAWGLLSLVLPDDAVDWAEGILRGARDALAAHGALLVGGNLAGTGSHLVADLALAGTVHPRRVLRRSGARPGDVLLVTGRLGASAAGRLLLDRPGGLEAQLRESLIEAHRNPIPRLAEARIAVGSNAANAAIDLSDGLAKDLLHLCQESGVAAEIDVDALPIDDATRAAASALGIPEKAIGIGGGEDYEILLCAVSTETSRLASEITLHTSTPCTPIGHIIAGAPRILWHDSRGREVAAPASGWDHFSTHSLPRS